MYNPPIPVTINFPGPSQCDGHKKLLIVGKIPANMKKVRLYLIKQSFQKMLNMLKGS